MGLDTDEALCVENMRAIIARAKAYGSFVRIDMEQSDYAERTLQLFRRRFHPEFGNAVGVVLQSYLRRTEQDVEQVIALGARVRSPAPQDRKSTRLNSSHLVISYAVFCLKKKKNKFYIAYYQ